MKRFKRMLSGTLLPMCLEAHHSASMKREWTKPLVIFRDIYPLFGRGPPAGRGLFPSPLFFWVFSGVRFVHSSNLARFAPAWHPIAHLKLGTLKARCLILITIKIKKSFEGISEADFLSLYRVRG